MKKIRIAQIGVEHDHASMIMNSLRTQKDIFEVVGFADPEEEWIVDTYTGKLTVGGRESSTLIPYEDVYKGLPQMSVEQILSIPDLDAVSIETSEKNLFKYAQMAADRCLSVHMDKPGGTDYRDFEKLVNTFKQSGKTLHLGYMYRYNPEIIKVIEDADAGKYGDIYSVECHMSCYHKDEKRAWMANYKGGMMFFLGCHLIDLIYRIQGEPEEVIPLNTVTGINGIDRGEDYGFAVLKYKNGVSFAKTCAAEAGGFLRRQVVVCGSKGTVEVHPIEAYTIEKDNPARYTLTREVCDDIYVWGNDGVKRKSFFDRYDGMMLSFAQIVKGEKVNPYSLDYELGMYKVLLKACGME
ncbi:MAG: Gfo/Idh/MocA family oxidoreductase [Oscillospiraceae bacterium]|nr:Gfo/Idh/MocA family oxidoreductase [Oscillospiraceae bacterium]